MLSNPFHQKKYELRVVAEGIRFSFRASITINLLAMLIPVVIAFVFWKLVDTTMIILWVMALWAVYLVRIAMAIRFQRQLRSDPETLKWGQALAAISFLSGCFWGVAIILFYSPDRLTETTIFLVTIATMVSGSLINRSYWLAEANAYAVPTIGIPIMYLLTHATGGLEQAMGYLLMIYLAMIIPSGMRLRENAYKLISLRFENRELLERMKLQKEKAEFANKSKTRFLAAANHDLRQPVNALGFLTYAMKNELNSTEGKNLYQKLELTVKNLGGLLKSLLDISHLDAATVHYKTEIVDFQLIARQMMTEFIPLASKHSLSLSLGPHHFSVLSDKMLLERIIRNLVDNAIRYTEKGGVLLGCRKRGDFLSIEVWDTGYGIQKAEIQHIFDEFYQINNPQRISQDGLGLGLPICQRSAALLGHELTVSSRYRKGSVFKLRVPLSDQPAYQHVQQRTPKIEGQLLNNKWVLIVDDDTTGTEAFSTVLKCWGANTLTASTLAEALQSIEENQSPPDIILTDYRLQHETGLEVIETLTNNGKINIPAVIVTGDTAAYALKTLHQSGYPVLHKPVAPEALYSTLVESLALD